MGLKRKVTKAEHAALNALIQAEYKAEGDEFVLDAEGFDDPAELRRAKDREVEARKVADAKVAELTTQLSTITNLDARRAGDVATLEKSWQAKLDAAKAEADGKLAKMNSFLQSTLVDGVATKLCSELAGDNAALLMPHVKTRLSADIAGETPLTRVLDKDGKLSAFSVEDLKKEIAGNPQFKAVIVASRASGGGAAGGNGGSGASTNGNKKFQELGDKERVEWYKRDPEGFKVAAAEAKTAAVSQPVRATI